MKILIMALFTSALLAVGCDPAGITGSGTITTKDHNVGSFDRLTVKGEINVDVSYGTTPSVRVETDDNLHSRITVRVINDVLEISADGRDVDFSTIKATVVMPTVNTVTTYGSGAVRFGPGFSSSMLNVTSYGSGDLSFAGLDADKVTSQINGSGGITLNGAITDHSCTLKGSGNMKADGCSSSQAAVAIFGSGNADVKVSTLLYADIFGSGNVIYRGDAELRTNLVGSGKLIKKS